jgi:hypothetical protein
LVLIGPYWSLGLGLAADVLDDFFETATPPSGFLDFASMGGSDGAAAADAALILTNDLLPSFSTILPTISGSPPISFAAR